MLQSMGSQKVRSDLVTEQRPSININSLNYAESITEIQ